MIDRRARDNAANALQALVSGAITNKEYERQYPEAREDPVLRAIHSQTWFLYSDMSKHRLTNAHAPSDEDRIVLDRCILFLKSDLEFRWRRTIIHLLYPVLRLLGLGRLDEKRVDVQMGAGDHGVWPFFTRVEYEATRRSAQAEADRAKASWESDR